MAKHASSLALHWGRGLVGNTGHAHLHSRSTCKFPEVCLWHAASPLATSITLNGPPTRADRTRLISLSLVRQRIGPRLCCCSICDCCPGSLPVGGDGLQQWPHRQQRRKHPDQGSVLADALLFKQPSRPMSSLRSRPSMTQSRRRIRHAAAAARQDSSARCQQSGAPGSGRLIH